jgi:hypothetical protein
MRERLGFVGAGKTFNRCSTGKKPESPALNLKL